MGVSKENYAAGDKVNASDLNQISKNANDGGGFRDSIQAGETISAFRPVFLDDTLNQWKYCDADDAARLQFDGFSLEAGSAGVAMKVQMEGIVRGLSGLDAGKKYYVQYDGTIGTSKGTAPILVGVALSATELLIKKDDSLEYIEIVPVATTRSSATWGDWDLSASIPIGAKYAEISASNQTGYPFGVRKNGSALDRYVTADVWRANHIYTVALDSGRIVEIYGNPSVFAHFDLLGYWI